MITENIFWVALSIIFGIALGIVAHYLPNGKWKPSINGAFLIIVAACAWNFEWIGNDNIVLEHLLWLIMLIAMLVTGGVYSRKYRLQRHFGFAIEQEKTNSAVAKAVFESIIHSLEKKPVEKLTKDKLRIYALSNMHVFLDSGLCDMGKAEIAIRSFESYLEKYDDVELYESYILTLELTYQYEKAREKAIALLDSPATKRIALEFLSSYTYCSAGLQSFSDCINFKEELIQCTTDIGEKLRLEQELQAMKNRQ